MIRRLVVALAAAAAVVAVAGPATAKPPGVAAKTAPKATSKTPPKAPKDALLAAADEIARQVAALRGLTIQRPIERGVLTRAEIGAKLRERIAKEYTPAEVRAESRVLKRLGLLPPNADYEKLILDLLMEQVAGFYDPFARKLYIADWLPLEMQRPALAHEIEHALQDQHFDLKRFAQPIKDDGDRQLAHSSLVEGDGTAVMLEFVAQAMGLPADQLPEMAAQIGKTIASGGMATTPSFDKAPTFLKETLIFPYFGGLGFVTAIHRQAPWSKVNDAFKNPPESTEQILHPEKYATHEAAVKITPAPLAALGARKEIRRDVLGEFEWKILFAAKLDDATAEKAAAGWGGDRLVAYADAAAPDSLPVVVDLSSWDTETDAKEAEAAARALFARTVAKPSAAAAGGADGGAAAAPASTGPSAVFNDGTDDFTVERRGQSLLLIFGVPPSVREATTDEVWRTWQVGK
jgi:hypothetical protein